MLTPGHLGVGGGGVPGWTPARCSCTKSGRNDTRPLTKQGYPLPQRRTARQPIAKERLITTKIGSFSRSSSNDRLLYTWSTVLTAYGEPSNSRALVISKTAYVKHQKKKKKISEQLEARQSTSTGPLCPRGWLLFRISLPGDSHEVHDPGTKFKYVEVGAV